MKNLFFCIRTDNAASFPSIICDNEEWIVSVYSVSFCFAFVFFCLLCFVSPSFNFNF